MFLRNRCWRVIFLLGVLYGCAPVREWNPLEYSVRPGDTLYSIAWRYEVDFMDIARWNNIDPPYAIFPGQRLQLSADDGSGSFGHDPVITDQSAAITESEGTEAERSAAETSVPVNPATTLVVQKGDTLFSIAQSHGIHYSQLARWNTLHPPYTLHAGQVLRLTAPEDRHAKSGSVIAAQKPPAKSPAIQPLATAGKPGVKKEPGGKTAAVRAWFWPAKGRVIKSFRAEDTARKGIAIAGKSGQSVLAAAGGRVVYSGNGLISYGNLIIIKHDDDYLSAYAHNRELLVAEGDDVKANQLIARMGENNGRAQLHFEIRKNGKPVNPLRYLPQG
ncbi:MAG: lipoprotein NlpD [Pseudomonadota bacterium]|nr:lipoprotein NlpD [Pseudomonadota bacterium]